MANSSTDVELGDVELVDQTVQFLLACEEKVDDRVLQPTIFTVPSVLRDISSRYSYDPKVVSIGPLHRDATNVQAMEVRKANYIHNLLASLQLPSQPTFEACVEKVIASIDKIKESYDEMKFYAHLELAKMMVTDGLFILDFVYNIEKHFSNLLLAQSIVHDLLLLENQIPFFVLQDLFECTISPCEPTASLIKIILKLLQIVHFVKHADRRHYDLQGTTPDHILDLLHKCYQSERSIVSELPSSTIPSATELVLFYEINFESPRYFRDRPSDPHESWPLKINFESPRYFGDMPTLIMPVLSIDDSTESIIRNLIVYEQSSARIPHYITSYAIAIDTIVDTKEDVALLVSSGVIVNNLGSNEEAANMINSIAKEISSTGFFYANQWNKFDDYSNGYWTKNLARWRRTYTEFRTPYGLIALYGGFILFILTAIQTFYAVKAGY